MGVCHELVVIADSEVNRLTEDDFYTLDLPWEDNRGLTLELIAELLSILSDEPVVQDLDAEFPLVSADDIDNGPWAYRISNEFVRLLADVEDDEADEIAHVWIPYEEPSPYTYPRPETCDFGKEYLDNLRRLAKHAISEKQSLFLRITL